MPQNLGKQYLEKEKYALSGTWGARTALQNGEKVKQVEQVWGLIRKEG